MSGIDDLADLIAGLRRTTPLPVLRPGTVIGPADEAGYIEVDLGGGETRVIAGDAAEGDTVQVEVTGNTAQQSAADVAAAAKRAADAALVNQIEEWATTSSPTTVPVDGWVTTTPAAGDGVYVWKRLILIWGDGTIEIGDPVLLTGNTGATGEAAALLRVESSRGVLFKHSQISTELTAVVFYGAERIANISALRAAFGPAARLEWAWRGIDDPDFSLISAADDRLSGDGFVLTVSPADVDVKAVFTCNLHT